ncbi:cytochrome c family protein [Roseomonas sp. NAR14]|uniref:Cytochrome c family protein n=1 Tax=Roseomonas acroporae TaxID=2937791 RepID=A0A9X2BW83_9PROT|nr:cytochrome c3 family protein [Roseomonas acroporae]MCK8787498.1 cytochrome c family protein [Roseomonas acroporae]
MTQIFSRHADSRLRLAAGLGLAAVAFLAVSGFFVARSGAAWQVGVPARQPIPFSHAVHAGQLGLDCRLCHAGVERQAAAGMPTAETCLGCHRQVWNVAAQFAPLRSALALDTPVAWASVSRLPDHVRFHHGAHMAASVPCETCHGQVRTMPQTVRAETLSMQWCLDCHRDPDPRRRPAGAVLARGGVPGDTPPEPLTGLGARRFAHFGVEISALTRCSTCHR